MILFQRFGQNGKTRTQEKFQRSIRNKQFVREISEKFQRNICKPFGVFKTIADSLFQYYWKPNFSDSAKKRTKTELQRTNEGISKEYLQTVWSVQNHCRQFISNYWGTSF
jgi:hypothetical protein